MNWRDRVLQLKQDKRMKFRLIKRIRLGHAKHSGYKGGFVYIRGKGQFGVEGTIGKKK